MASEAEVLREFQTPRSPNSANPKGDVRSQEKKEAVASQNFHRGRKRKGPMKAQEEAEAQESEGGKNFTTEAVEQLIEQARVQACVEQGRDSRAGTDLSQLRQFHKAVHEGIFVVAKPTVGQLQEVISFILKMTEEDVSERCRLQPTFGRRNLFPLPVSGWTGDFENSSAVLQSVAMSLNSLNGSGSTGTTKTSVIASRVMKRLAETLKGSPILPQEIPCDTFETFFQEKKLDYQGEEVRVARNLNWEELEPALPLEVGRLSLRDFCTGGVLDYIDRFEDFLLDPKDQYIGKTPRVMVEPSKWKDVAKGLLDRGLCKIIPKSKVHHVGNLPLLNGMFAVSKGEWQGTTEICRLIMNLKPTNQVCRPLTADTATLPSINHLSTLVLEPDSVLLSSSEDIKCFFYLFRVPEKWMSYLAFGAVVPTELIPEELRSEEAYLTSTVLPMGWLNSVGIAQHVHRNVVRNCLGSMETPIGGESELRRDRVFSSAPHLFRIYLDNFDELRKVDRKTANLIEGEPSKVAIALREAYEKVNLPRHPRKSV